MKKERPEGTSHKKGSLWAMSPDRLEVIEKEIDKLQKKYADDIRASMKYPGKTEYVVICQLNTYNACAILH